MAKRGPVSELNHDNWNDEEEPEEAGIFTQASKDVLQQRTIKKAKRRGLESSSGSKPAFSGFLGLGSKAAPPKTGTMTGLNKSAGEVAFGMKSNAFGGASSMNGNEDQKLKGQGDSKESSVYLSFLKSLNESVLAWIKQHVEENPYIILTPIFKDYEQYLEAHEGEKSPITTSPSMKRETGKDNKNGENTTLFSSKTVTSSFGLSASKTESDDKEKSDPSKAKPFTFGQTSSTATTDLPTNKGITFGLSTTSGTSGFSFSSNSTPAAGFSFGQTNSAATTASSTAPSLGKPSFSFGTTGSATGSFSFGLASSSQGSSSAGASQEADTNDDEEYVPPKPEVKEIVEDDALYSKRCKLYYQKEGQWVDRGVGNLHLKPVDDKKTQLLIRADTNLGNILLNIMLSASLPVSRQGKNNVCLVCVANPPINTKAEVGEDEKPTPMLIRVKAESDADELFAKIEERKKLL